MAVAAPELRLPATGVMIVAGPRCLATKCRALGRHLARPLRDAVERVCRGRLAHFGQARKSECREGHDDVTDCNVIEACSNQVRGDAEQPTARDVGAQSRPAGQDRYAYRELDD